MAKAAGKDHTVVTGKETKVYGPVRDKGSTVVERDDLGPKCIPTDKKKC